MSESEMVRFEINNFVGVITINRPPVNAVNAALRDRLTEIFDAATDRDDIRCLVLTAEG